VLQACSNALGFLTALLLARLLGSEEFGQYSFAFAWASFLVIVALVGMDQLLVRGIAQYEVQQDYARMRGLLRRASHIVLATSCGIGAVGCLVAIAFSSPELKAPICAAMALVPITALTFVRQGAMQALGKVVLGQFPEYLIAPVLILAGVAVLAVAGGGWLSATTCLLCYVVATGIACGIGALLLRRSLPEPMSGARPLYDTKVWLKASVPMMLINGVWSSNRYVSILILGMIAGPTSAGVYNVVERGAAAILLVHLAINMPLAPVLARLHAEGDQVGVERESEHMARIATVVSLPVCIAFAVFPTVYLGIFGSGFDEGATAMSILALAQIVNAATGPAGTVLIMSGLERPAMWATGAGSLVNVILGFALVPFLGITGAAIAFAASLIAWNMALVLLGRRLAGVNVTAFHGLAIAQRMTTDENEPAGLGDRLR
jgi:O-antigen/teichoic acid export membrane protein